MVCGAGQIEPFEQHLVESVLFGSVGGVIIGLVTEYYTSSKPIVRIAESGANRLRQPS